MIISFEDKVALVTGAASGMGLATAKTFAESGRPITTWSATRKMVLDASFG